MESRKREREVSRARTARCTKTQYRPPPGRDDRDTGDDGQKGSAEELWWTVAPGEAISRKRGGRQTHFGESRPWALTGDRWRLPPLDMCLLLRLLTMMRLEKLKQRKQMKATDGAHIRLRPSPPFLGAVANISLDMTAMVPMKRLMSTNSTGRREPPTHRL
jgi:hypothetical protein